MSRTEQSLLFAFLILSVLGMATAYLLLDGAEYQRVSEGPVFRLSVSRTVDLERKQALERMDVGTFELTAADAELLQALSELYEKQRSLTLLSKTDRAEASVAKTWAGYEKNAYDYREKVAAYVERYGLERYIRLGRFTRGVFLAALARVTNHLSDPEGLEPGVDEIYVARAVPAIEKLMGSYLAWSLESGMAVSRGEGRSVHLFTAGLVYKLGWLHWLGNEPSVGRFLTTFERQSFLAYRVEFEPNLKHSDRELMLNELHEMSPGYPIDVMRIITLAKFGDSDQALDLLGEALQLAPKNLMLSRLKSLVEGRLDSRVNSDEKSASPVEARDGSSFEAPGGQEDSRSSEDPTLSKDIRP